MNRFKGQSQGIVLALVATVLFTPQAQAAYPDPPTGSGHPYTQIIPGQNPKENCPVGYQYANGLIVDLSWPRGQREFTECWPEAAFKANRIGGSTWESFKASGGTMSISEIDAVQARWDEYYRELDRARAAAEAESRRWNEANPGKQKCVQWGPITAPDGVGQSSGGVCANPVPAGTAPSGSATADAPSVGEGDIGGASSSPAPVGSSGGGSPATSEPVTSGSSSSSSSAATSSPAAQGSNPDPSPTGGADYRGSGFPFTYIAEGQLGTADCPAGFQAANGLIVDVSAKKTYTECWPLRAWTAYRLGGDAWDLFKATGGTYDPTVEVERREKVALLKAKAKEVAETAAKQTPGIERCSAWSGFGESGRECAYAFIAPSSSSPERGSTASPATSESQSVTQSQTVTVVTVTSSPVVSDSQSNSGSDQSSSSSATTSVAVGLETVSVTGNSVQIAKTALAVTSDPAEAKSISALATGITAVPNVIRNTLQSLPRVENLTYEVKSLTPQICKASSFRVRISKTGLCEFEIEITDSEGNTYEILKKIRRRG
jgi:hypothetical protein